MCIIIIKQKGLKVSTATLKKSAKINPHGLGIIWLDTYKVEYKESSEYSHLVTDRPYIAHFRYATVGAIGRSNMHPFVCGKKTDELLMMNGTIAGMGNEKVCDSKILAESLGELPRQFWTKSLEKHNCRFITANIRNRSFQIYNKLDWFQRAGVWFSKENVLQENYVAVYGTLKYGYSNYFAYLSTSSFLGSGKTKDKYPLVVDRLPYLIEDKGKGYHVNVDVFKVTGSVFDNLDILEGHPNWYQRKQIRIDLKGKSVLCWVYFNIRETSKGRPYQSTYVQKPIINTLKHFKVDKYIAPSQEYNIDIFNERHLPEYVNEFEIEKEIPMCLYCYNDLVFDGFNNYYCSSCNNWFAEKDVVKDF